MAGIAYLQWLTLEKTSEIASIAQRPYVSATDIRLTERHGIFSLEVLVTNSGGTPTRGMRYLALRATSPQQASDPADAFYDPPSPFQVHRVPVAPNATIPLGWGGYVGPLVEKMAAERSIIFLYGIIYYKGQSPDSPQYVTKYCFDVHPVKRGDALQVEYNQCVHWNCMDSDCTIDRCIYEVRKTEPDYNKAQQKCTGLSEPP